ncbi:hypothetical protein HPULCUR_003804 [Helicostylum pulchrum]|uniref:Uncharacterized protein n=1 Tax=Helicostylum pulchrum TaxID=562976 RepID=A0ABP9XUE3_9FUNG
MSDHEMEGLEFENRTTANLFNERLLRAREEASNDEIDDRINLDGIFDSDDPVLLEARLKTIEEQVKRMESKVRLMEDKLEDRKARRALEASLTNMTPEERAIHFEKQEEENPQDIPDLDVIFEYLLLLSSAPPDDVNDLSTTDFIKPHAGIRKKALEDTWVLKQEKYSSVHFVKADNVLESNPDAAGEIRHCELGGNCHDMEFNITFDVLEPSMEMSNLVFEVGIEMQLEIGDILERIREECDLLQFFRVLTHYATLEKERKTIFEKLVDRYSNTELHIELLSPSKLMFEGSSSAYITLEWNTEKVVTDKFRLDCNAANYIKPILSMEAFNLGNSNDGDSFDIASQMNDYFMMLLKMRGVYEATEFIVNKVFMPLEEEA